MIEKITIEITKDEILLKFDGNVLKSERNCPKSMADLYDEDDLLNAVNGNEDLAEALDSFNFFDISQILQKGN